MSLLQVLRLWCAKGLPRQLVRSADFCLTASCAHHHPSIASSAVAGVNYEDSQNLPQKYGMGLSAQRISFVTSIFELLEAMLGQWWARRIPRTSPSLALIGCSQWQGCVWMSLSQAKKLCLSPLLVGKRFLTIWGKEESHFAEKLRQAPSPSELQTHSISKKWLCCSCPHLLEE